MKKKILATFFSLALLFNIAISTTAAPRWSYFSNLKTLITMENGAITWGASATTYSVTEVTATKCTVTLQAADSYGWYTIDSDTTMLPGNYASGRGTYKDWTAGTSYRVKVEAWAYVGNSVVESVGPLYDYYNA